MATQTKTPPRSGTVTPPAKQQPASSNLPVKLTQENVAGVLFSEHVRHQVQKALPQHLKPERMLRMALTTVRNTPKLLECSQGSLIAGIVQASELGLELAGPLGEAYLIPRLLRGTMTACFQVGYRGFISLAHRTNQVAFFDARAVSEGDEFEYELGSTPFVRHKRGRGNPGKITDFYGVLKKKGATEALVEVWTNEMMEAHRDKFRSDKSLRVRDKNYRGPWDDHYGPMGCKTLIREVAKRAHLSPELTMIAARDEYEGLGLETPVGVGDLAAGMNGNGQGGQTFEAATPIAMDEIDIQMQRAGVYGNAAIELLSKYGASPGEELSEAAAQELLRELSAMPDIEA